MVALMVLSSHKGLAMGIPARAPRASEPNVPIHPWEGLRKAVCRTAATPASLDGRRAKRPHGLTRKQTSGGAELVQIW